MNITTKTEGTTTTIIVDGWLDTATAPELDSVISSIGEETKQLVIDFAKLEYISSAGLRQLVVAHRKMSGNLTIINVLPEVREVLHMAGFDKRLNIE